MDIVYFFGRLIFQSLTCKSDKNDFNAYIYIYIANTDRCMSIYIYIYILIHLSVFVILDKLMMHG